MKYSIQLIDPEFFVDPKPLTEVERKRISESIRADKEKRAKLKTSKKKGAHAQSS